MLHSFFLVEAKKTEQVGLTTTRH